MANHKQAIKRHTQSLGRNKRNSYFKATCRTHVKAARLALEADDKGGAADAVKIAVATLDKIAGKGIMPKTRAARVKGRLMGQLARL